MLALRPIALACVVACASPRTPAIDSPAPSLVVPVTSTVAPAPLPDAEATRTAASPPAEVREPGDVACRIPGLGWGSYRLRLRRDGPPFARADRVHATLALPATTTPHEAVVSMDDGRVLVRAVLSVSDVYLFARKPKPLLGIVTPAASTELSWVSSTPGSVRIAVGTGAVLRAPQPFVTDVGCTDLAIVPAGYDARGSVTTKKGLAKRDVIHDGTPIAATPTSPPVAELNAVQVELVETRGAQARIVVDEISFVVSGWVAQKDLGPPAVGGRSGAGGRGGERMDTINRLYLMHCPTDVDLFVELDSDRVKVGAIHKEAGFRPSPPTDDDGAPFRSIDLPDSQWFRLEKGARLVVEAPALKACRQDSPGF